MKNIRKKGLLILCILSMCIIFASCNKEENKTATNEDKLEVMHADTVQTNQKDSYEKTIEVDPRNGNHLTISIKNLDDSQVCVIIWENNKKIENTLLEGNESQEFNYSITKSTTYKLYVSSGYSGNIWSAEIKAKQFNE